MTRTISNTPPGAEYSEAALKRTLATPLRITLSWWAFSLVVFAILFPTEQKLNFGLVILTVTFASIAVFVGYSSASRSRARQIEFSSSTDPNKTLILASACLMIFAGVASAQALGFTPSTVVESFGNLGSAYSNRTTLQSTTLPGSTGTLITSGLFFLFPFAVPLSIMHWSALSRGMRLLVVGGVVSYGGYFLAGGTMKGFGDLTILLVIGILVRAARARISGNRAHVSKQRRRWFYAQVGAVGIFLWIVATAMASRLSGRAASLPIFQDDGLLGRILGPDWSVGVEAMTAYFAKGYRGLGLAMDYPPPYDFYGGFRGVSDLLSRYVGLEDAYANSLPLAAQNATGYSATANWWTVFPWLASDFGWVGAILFVGGIGFLAGRLWVNIIYQQDALSVGLFYFVLMFLLFVPANNQVFIDSGSTIGSLVLLTAYTLRGIVRAGRGKSVSPGSDAPVAERPGRLASSALQ